MSDNDVSQSNNKVDGDQAGRDVNKNVSAYNFVRSKETITYMTTLLNKFKEERDGNVLLSVLIEDFDYYKRPYKGDVVGLEQKLKDGGRDDFISYALKSKERFHKKLIRYQFFESAQKINVYLLALVESYFENHICPKIYKGQSSEEIKGLIQELLINPLLNELEENLLGFTAADINGMLYFLTGNCHIKWTK